MNLKVILISDFPLPYTKIGSWTSMYTNYLQTKHNIDYVICPKPEEALDGVNYVITENNSLDKLKRKYYRNPYYNILKSFNKLIKPNENYIIQLVDNFGLVSHLQEMLIEKKLRSQCFIQFFYHGFDPFYGNFQSRSFFEQIDEMVVLTKDCYKAHLNYYTVLPCSFKVLHNGVDNSLFKILSLNDKKHLKEEFGLSNKKIFLWCANDRPKKGLKFVLRVWKLLTAEYANIHLLVVGSDKHVDLPQVTSFGRLPHNELPKYYQVSDFYLFPTLCKEGFGLTLIEALNCGCVPIASKLGGVAEVLKYGELGILVENPNFIENWLQAITEVLDGKNIPQLQSNYYSMAEWSAHYNALINKTKLLLK